MNIFHRHRWVTYEVEYGQFVVVKGDATALLQRCACGETRTKTLNGHWSRQALGLEERP